MKVTHCPNCQTCFKVTDEQLKLYNGKVRCGRCAFVFNAMNHLIEVEEMAAQTLHMPPNAIRQENRTESKPAGLPPAVTPATPEAAAPFPDLSAAQQADAGTATTDIPATPATEPEDAPAQPEADNPFLPRSTLQEALTSGTASSVPVADHPTGIVEPIEEIEIKAPAETGSSDEPIANPAGAGGANSLPPSPAKPFYVEPEIDLELSPQHELNEQQESSVTRTFKPIAELNDSIPDPDTTGGRAGMLWGAGTALAAAALLLQFAYHNRTQLSLSLPGLKPAMEAACSLAGCQIPLPADDEQIRIDSLELTPDPAQPRHIRLSATLFNKATFDQALPLLELTLTDQNEQVVVKRVFEPADYLDKSHPPTRMPAKAELQALLSLDIGDTKVSGYRAFLFYPK